MYSFSTDSSDFKQGVQNLSFYLGPSDMTDKQCYNITIIDDSYCEYYDNCTNEHFFTELTTDSQYVRLVNDTAQIFIVEQLDQCGRL